MLSNELLNVIKGKGFSVQGVVQQMHDKYDISITVSTFYKKVKDVEKFRGNEIQAVALILNLTLEQTGRIFFNELVA